MKNLFYLIIFVSVSLSIPAYTQAHFKELNNGVSVLIHIDPADLPYAGGKSVIHASIKSDDKKFSLDTCACSMSIQKDGKELLTQHEIDEHIHIKKDELILPFIFETSGIYKLTVFGNTFKTHFDIRVENANTSQSDAKSSYIVHMMHIGHYALFGSAFVISIFFIIRDKRKKNGYNTSVIN